MAPLVAPLAALPSSLFMTLLLSFNAPFFFTSFLSFLMNTFTTRSLPCVLLGEAPRLAREPWRTAVAVEIGATDGRCIPSC